jgi:hypothetical protein|tara:strand:+ start:145 stop:333 length:189 start_codon:yes stop_codon:yes gene_type:complete
MARKFRAVAKTRKGVPKKYLKGSKNKSKREREILNTIELYKAGKLTAKQMNQISKERSKDVK